MLLNAELIPVARLFMPRSCAECNQSYNKCILDQILTSPSRLARSWSFTNRFKSRLFMSNLPVPGLLLSPNRKGGLGMFVLRLSS